MSAPFCLALLTSARVSVRIVRGEKMTRRERLESIFLSFDKSAKEFSESAGGLFCETTAEYKGESEPENLKYRYAKIYFNAFVVGFKYSAHGMLGIVNSVLECFVYPGKGEDTPGIPLPIVEDYCDKVALPPAVPCISNETGMKQAFDCIGGALLGILPEISEIAFDEDKKNGLISYYYSEIENVFDIETGEEENGQYAFYKSDTFYRFITNRFTANAFIQLIKGNRERAEKELKKYKKALGYERKALKLLQSKEKIFVSDISAAAKNLEIFGYSGAQKLNFKELLTLFISWFILGAGAAVVYAGVFLLTYFLEKRGSVYLMGALYNLPYCFLCAFITGIAASYFTRFRFYKVFFKKDYERYAELDQITNSKAADKFMRFLTGVIVICSLVGGVLFAKQNINFSQDGFTDNSSLFSLTGEYHDYKEIDRIYYRPNRVNGFGETIDFPSYVLALKSGEEIDFYEYDEIENYETELLGFLESKGVKITKRVSN